MASKSKPSMPTAPNWNTLATRQGTLNKGAADQTTLANRPNQIGPSGSMTWTVDPKTGQWTQKVGMSAANQGQYNDITGLQNEALDAMDIGPIDTSGFTKWGDPSKLGAGFGNVKQVQDAMMGILRPGLDQSRAAEIQRLKSQGLTEGSDAWNAAVRNLGQTENDASLKALLAGTTEYGNIFNRQLAANKYSDALRGQQYDEAFKQHGIPFSDYSALSTAKSGLDPRFQSFQTATPYQAPNILDAASETYSDDVNRYNAEMAQYIAATTGYWDLAKSAGSEFLGPLADYAGDEFKDWVKSWWET